MCKWQLIAPFRHTTLGTQAHQHTHAHSGIITTDCTLYAIERTWEGESYDLLLVIFPLFLITFPLVSSTLPQRRPSPTAPAHPTSLNLHQSPFMVTASHHTSSQATILSTITPHFHFSLFFTITLYPTLTLSNLHKIFNSFVFDNCNLLV